MKESGLAKYIITIVVLLFVLIALICVVVFGLVKQGNNSPDVPENTTEAQHTVAETTEEATQASAEQLDTADICLMMENASNFAFSWFYENAHTDKSKTITATYEGRAGFPHELVNKEGINSKEDIKNLTMQYFSADAAEQLMGYKNWIEKDGRLYVSRADGLGGDTPLLKVTSRKVSDTLYVAEVDEWMFDTMINSYTVNCRYENGFWVFDRVIICDRAVAE